MDVIPLTSETFQEQIEHGVTVVAKVNLDEETELASNYGVRSSPTILIFKDGYQVETLVGLQSKESLQRQIELYSALGGTC